MVSLPATEPPSDLERAIVMTIDEGEGDEGYLQPLAGFGAWSARPLGAGARVACRPRRADLPSASDWRLVHDGIGYELGRPRRVRAYIDSRGRRRVELESGSAFLVAADGREVRRADDLPAAAGETPSDRAMRALGAPMALALAVRGAYLLHASALVLEERVVAFTAASGVGKSTLAVLGEREGWRRVADDLLPVRFGRRPVALPHFPQPKLSRAAAYPPDAEAELPFGGLVELHRRAGPAGPVRVTRRNGAEAAIALARSGVATRLFDSALVERHLADCGEACDRLVVLGLEIPTNMSRLAEGLERVARELD